MQTSSTQPSVLSKNGAHVRLSCRSTESYNILTGKCLWWRRFFTKDTSLEFIPAISLKKDSNSEVFSYGFFKVTIFKLLENFLRDVFTKHFLTKSQAFNLQVATLQEITCLTKFIEIAFNSKGYLYCVKNYIYIGMRMPMSMPMPLPMPRCPCRDFQMTVLSAALRLFCPRTYAAYNNSNFDDATWNILYKILIYCFLVYSS